VAFGAFGGGLAGSALGRVLVEVGVDTRPMESGLAQAKGKAETAGTGIGSTLKTAIAAGAVVAGAALVKFGAVSLKAFTNLQQTTLKLQNTLANNPRLADVTAASWDKQSHSLQELTGVQDENIRSAQAVLGQFKLTGRQVQELIPLVVDLSQKMGIDMTAASKAVGKATQGNTGILQRYGIMIQKSADGTVHFSDVVKGLGVVQGYAEERGKTFAGQMDILKSNIQDAEEAFGKFVEQLGVELLPVIKQIVPLLGLAAKNAHLLLGVLVGMAAAKFLPPLLAQIAAGLQAIGAEAAASRVAGTAMMIGWQNMIPVAGLLFGAIQMVNQAHEDQKTSADNVTTALKGNLVSVHDVTSALADLKAGHLQLQDSTTKTLQQLGLHTDLTSRLQNDTTALTDGLAGYRAEQDRGTKSTQDNTKAEQANAAAHQKTIQALQAQRAAQQALLPGLVGLQGNILQLANDHKNLADALKKSGRNSLDYKNAVQQLLSDQLSFNQSLKDYGKNLLDSGERQATVEAKLRSLGRQAGLSKGDIDALIRSVEQYTNKLQQVPADVWTTFHVKGSTGPTRWSQHGFHGIVSGPMIFGAGEAGRERVDITPEGDYRRSFSSGDGGGLTININAPVYGVDHLEQVIRTAARRRDLLRAG